MLIGLDLDNTIIKYDELFHGLALEKSLIGPDLAVDKTTVCDHIRLHHGDEAWQDLQALAYGPRLNRAVVFPGVHQVLRRWRAAGFRLAIISHKTPYSSRGRQELRGAALDFLRENDIIPLISRLDVHFVNKVDEKVALIADLKCRVFVDDLPKILLHPEFPAATGRILFDPNGTGRPGLTVCSDWEQIGRHVLESGKDWLK